MRILALCSMLIIAVTACSHREETTLDADNIKNITIEAIDSDNKSVSSAGMSEEDITSIKELLSAEEKCKDKGFVFAEGIYRVVLEYENETMYLYPYCGNASRIRVGDSGVTYIELESEQQAAFEEVIEKYIDIKGGIWEWEEYEDN